MVSTLLNFIFPPPLFVKTMSVVSAGSLAYIGFKETIGEHMQYSKFLNVNAEKSKTKQIVLSSRNGFLITYTPAFLAGVSSFWLFPDEGLRFLLVKSALTFHFFKRILEVLFIHKYSGGMEVESMIPITLSYFISTAMMIYSQHLTQGFPEPTIDLTYPGIVLFLLGISGNFYHHCLLSKLRSKNDKEYKIPKGGLFDLVICPHHLCEIIGLLGISFIAQTLYGFSFTAGTTFYLMGRSYVTRKWYLSKFEDFPKDVKAIIPFVF